MWHQYECHAVNEQAWYLDKKRVRYTQGLSRNGIYLNWAIRYLKSSDLDYIPHRNYLRYQVPRLQYLQDGPDPSHSG